MKSRITTLAVLVALLLVFLLARRFPDGFSNPSSAPSPSSATSGKNAPASPQPPAHPPATSPSASLPDANDFRVTRLADGRVLYNPSVDASRTLTPEIPPEDAFDVIMQILEHYQFAYQENPIGENSEITAQLLGNNPKKILFLAPDCPALHDGQLTDSWGTPFFFHSISATRMTLASAGPDRVFWTGDDLSTDSPHTP